MKFPDDRLKMGTGAEGGAPTKVGAGLVPRRSECLQPGSVPLDFAQSTARASMRTGDWRHRPRYHDPEQISRRQHGKRGHRRPNGGIKSGRVASPPISSLSSFSTHPALATEAEGWPSRPCHVLSKASSRPLMNAYRRHWNKGFGFLRASSTLGRERLDTRELHLSLARHENAPPQ